MRLLLPIVRPAIIACLALASARSQSVPANAQHLASKDVDIVFAPDSAGALIWARLKKPSGTQHFIASMVPRDVQAWAIAAHEFLRLSIANSDTGETRASGALRGLCGERVYLMRRRSRGSWSDERFLILESARDTQPIILSGTPEEIAAIVRNIAVAAWRSPYDEKAADRRRLDDTTALLADSPASPHRGNRPPAYAMAARRASLEGIVLLTFVVGEDGKAETGTARALYASDELFLAEVRRALPALRFQPAMKDGKPMRTRVSMPFEFSLIR